MVCLVSLVWSLNSYYRGYTCFLFIQYKLHVRYITYWLLLLHSPLVVSTVLFIIKYSFLPQHYIEPTSWASSSTRLLRSCLFASPPHSPAINTFMWSQSTYFGIKFIYCNNSSLHYPQSTYPGKEGNGEVTNQRLPREN